MVLGTWVVVRTFSVGMSRCNVQIAVSRASVKVGKWCVKVVCRIELECKVCAWCHE